MNASDRLAEASKQLRISARDGDLTSTQQEIAMHLAGIVDGLATSVDVLSEAELVTDGGGPTTERASEKLREREEESVADALQSIEQNCELDETCRQTAVTYVDGTPACDYHSGELFGGDSA